jgi:hypothetical protein
MVKFAAGQPDSWNLVYGFEKGKPVINEAQAGLMRQLFVWRDEEYSVYDIEEMVTAYAKKHGLQPPRGDRWHAKTLMNWLKSRQYVCEYHRCGEIYELPRIIEQDLFDRVQAKMAATRQKTQGNPSTKYTWTGILFSEHDAPMHGVRDHDLMYYRCSGAVRRSKVTEFTRCACSYIRANALEPVWKAIWTLLHDPKMQRAQAQAIAREEEAGKPARGKDARQKLAELKAREKRVKDNYEDGDITREEKQAKLAAIRDEMQALEAEARAMGRVVEIAPLSAYEATCAALANVEEPEGDDRREVLDGLRDLKVRLEGNEAVITGSIPVNAAHATGGGGKNCEDRLAGLHSSLSPFRLKIKLAA